jgi:hypothetical protein
MKILADQFLLGDLVERERERERENPKRSLSDSN